MAVEDNESCGSRAVESTSPRKNRQKTQKTQKMEVYNEVLSRLYDMNHEEAKLADFEDQLWLHFNRLPLRYALDLNVERAEDVLTHKRLLHLAKDPANRPAFEVRPVQVQTMPTGNVTDINHSDSSTKEDAQSYSSQNGLHAPPTFGSSQNLEVLAHQSSTHYADNGESNGTGSLRPMHEITFSTVDRPKLLSQLIALVSEAGLNLQEAHAFSTADGFSLDVFVVDGWPHEQTEQLRNALEKEILKAKGESGLGPHLLPTISENGQTGFKSTTGHAKIPTDGTDVWEIDASLLTFEKKVASGSFGDLKWQKCQRVSLKDIEDATENFNERYVLGQGGEAKVYLAQIMLDRNIITRVAVKYLKPNSSVFEDEIQIMSKIQHPNIVSLLGYCDDSGQKILLYEYMANGSLAGYLQKKLKPIVSRATTTTSSLSWQQRLKICLGAALGLTHLHAETQEFSKGIIHRDVKPENILLDVNCVAKISDFGMFKLSRADQIDSAMPTMLKGTGGYYAPEYLNYGHVTRKIDVYAFGVVLFQVLCRKMPWDREGESYYRKEEEDLGQWARQNVDSEIQGEISDYCLNAFTEIIQKSLIVDPEKRPTMDEVALTLLNALEHHQM